MGGFLANTFVLAADQRQVIDAAVVALGPYVPRATRPTWLEEELGKLVGRGSGVPGLREALQQLGAGRQPGDDGIAMFVGPCLDGWVGIYADLMEADPGRCPAFARALSLQLKTTAICFEVYDGDYVRYWLAREGELLDEFHSIPDYFGEELSAAERRAVRGKPQVLADACGRPPLSKEIGELLRAGLRDADDLLEQLTELLGIRNGLATYRRLGGDRASQLVEQWDKFAAITWCELRSGTA